MDYKAGGDPLESLVCRGPNLEILDHDKKRQVELKCLEMSELMEDQGWVGAGLASPEKSSGPGPEKFRDRDLKSFGTGTFGTANFGTKNFPS